MPVVDHPDQSSVWKPVVGYESDYMVSENGDVVSTKTAMHKPMKLYLASHGYYRVNLCAAGKQKPHYIHELVAAAFIGPRPAGQQVRHLNSIKTDNRAANLAYGTQSENEADKDVVGLSNKGSRHGMSKLSENTVRLIKLGLMAGVSGTELAKRYGVHKNTIYHIKKHRTWREEDAGHRL